MYSEGYNRILTGLSDKALIKEITDNLKKMRLSKNMSQQELADKSGISRVAISRMEAGTIPSLLTVVQLLRAMDNLDILNVFIREPEISPIQLLREQEARYKRAHKKRK